MGHRIGQLFELLKNSVADKDGINAMLELGKRHEKGVKIIRKAIISDKTPLTPREREIADRLYISEATVRTILRSVYSKLDIHSKTELDTKKF
jgi:LuxR family maltose regulon positive regulatory protein